jgi:hypothetical protein
VIWEIKDKEHTIKTCFAFFPKRIGDYRIWLQRYYKTWDFLGNSIYSSYVPHWFIYKENAEEYVRKKMSET